MSTGGVNPRFHLKHLHPDQSQGTVFSGSCFPYFVPVVSKATNLLNGELVSVVRLKKGALFHRTYVNIYNNL